VRLRVIAAAFVLFAGLVAFIIFGLPALVGLLPRR